MTTIIVLAAKGKTFPYWDVFERLSSVAKFESQKSSDGNPKDIFPLRFEQHQHPFIRGKLYHDQVVFHALLSKRYSFRRRFCPSMNLAYVSDCLSVDYFPRNRPSP
jgi:hypothetical protein